MVKQPNTSFVDADRRLGQDARIVIWAFFYSLVRRQKQHEWRQSLKFAKALILINGILFIGFGLGFILAPVFFSTLFTGGHFTTPSAIIDVRATYGGLALGLGIWLVICTKQNVRLGLVGSFAILASLIIGRVTGIALDGSANIFMQIFLAAEVLFLLATWYALRAIKQ